MEEEEKIKRELQTLQREHKQIGVKIDKISSQAMFDQLMVQRMKKRKLWLKDRISELESFLYDDIIA